MSLAEDIRRPFEASAALQATPRLQARIGMSVPKIVPTLGREMRIQPPPPPSSTDSLDLLDKASKSVVFLLGRYRQLEEHVRQLDAWSKAQIQAAEISAARWQETAGENERKVQELQRSVDAITRRAETAENSLQRERQTLSSLEERIIGAFGFGSEAHDALAGLDLD